MLITNPDVSRKKDISLSLILTTYNRLDVLQRFIESLLKHKIVNSYEVILLNQGIPNPNIKLIFEQQGWQLIEIGTLTPLSIVRNIGLSHCRGDLVGFPDDDCWYAPKFIDDIIEKFYYYKDYTCICVSVFDPIVGKPYGNRPKNLCCNLTFTNVAKLPVSVGIFIRTDFIHKNSLKFNEKLGAGTFYGGGEETAFLCSLLKRNARIIYDGSLSVYHEIDDYSEILLAKVEKYSRGYGYVAGAILVNHRYEAVPSFLIFILKSSAGLLLRSYKKKYFLMYSTRLKYFFEGVFKAFKSSDGIF